MREITPENADLYLRDSGRIPEDRAVAVRAFGGGVSNVVMRVEVEGEPPFVLKQAREKLRTKKLWVSRLERIWTERDALEWLGLILPEGVVPRVLFSDDENYLYAMTHAPLDAVVWKQQLLSGAADPKVARLAGEILGVIHGATRAPGARFHDATVFDELRIDPFYREIARVHPEIAPSIAALIASMADAPDRCLVLGDFSPKNILVHAKGLTLVDFETAHAGDPAFDLGFFLSHLVLKSLRATVGSDDPAAFLDRDFQAGYRATVDDAGLALWERARQHMYACMLARIDGKSPVDYLDDEARARAREAALHGLRRASDGTGNAIF